jgi:diguanylate cyclase (GGDEF)-like protein
MPDCSAPDALRRAETVRVGVSGLSVMHEGRPLESVTISAGVASFPGNGDARDVLVQAADAALYRSKREGRNRVTPADLITAPLALVPGD